MGVSEKLRKELLRDIVNQLERCEDTNVLAILLGFITCYLKEKNENMFMGKKE